jgi:nitrate reductase gamma subunit
VDDFDLSGPVTAAAPVVPPLTDVTIVFALLSYFAAAVLIVGLAVQSWRLLRQIRRTPPDMGSGSTPRKLFRAATDIVLLRDSFFADRWSWIFGLMFHVGLLLILFRHLRYFIQPAWVGPLWNLVVLEQPFGLYGGLALPAGAACWWLRQIVLKQRHVIRGWADHAVMGVLVALPLVGYANTLEHTDVVAVHAFGTGLLTFRWRNLPFDPLLLVHLLLVATLLLLLPFSRVLLLLPFGKLLHVKSISETIWPEGHGARRWKSPLAFGIALVCVMLVPIAIVVDRGVTGGWTDPKPDYATLVADHKTDDDTVMIRDHPGFLFSHRTIVTHTGVGSPADSLERCVTCHAVKDPSGQPVGFDNPNHFCRGCHNTAAVSIDCFECHTSKPSSGAAAGLDPGGIVPFRRSAMANTTAAEKDTTP